MEQTWKSRSGAVLLILQILFFSEKGPAQAPFSLDDYGLSLIARAQGDKLADSRGWRKLLFISDSQVFPSRSLVDDPEFFLSPRGWKDPAAELEASLIAFLRPGTIRVKTDMVEHPRCIFPARWYFLKKHLQIDEAKVLKVECKKFQEYRQLAQYTGVSLVFSSYYINSPASMFGHTLLRMHREQDGQNNNGLLDDAANFAASVPKYNALLYPFQGLLGFFNGQFSLLPYFKKIQDYNNYESRDLWEYRLNFTQEEVDFLTYVLYEMGSFAISYYYLDDNCSFILNLTLEAAKPELQLTHNFYLYSIPVDTLKTVVNSPGLVRPPEFRPSSFSRYQQRVSQLGERQQQIMVAVIGANGLTPLEQATDCVDNCRAEVLDTVIEYIDFKEKLSGMREAENFGDLRRAGLLARSKLKIHPRPLDQFPSQETPHTGHWSSAVGLSSGPNTAGYSSHFLQWKPALHDLDAHTQAYGSQMQLSFLATDIAWNEEFNQLYIERLRALELFSVPRGLPGHKPWGWYLNMGADVLRPSLRTAELFTRYSLELGSGLSWYFLKDRIQMYLYGHLMGGFSPHRRVQWFVAPVIHSGFRVRFSDIFQAYLETRYDYLLGLENFDFWQSKLRFTYYYEPDFEIFVEAQYRTSSGIGLMGFRHYY